VAGFLCEWTPLLLATLENLENILKSRNFTWTLSDNEIEIFRELVQCDFAFAI